MSRILVKVGGKDAMILGYCPTESGVHAIIVRDGALEDVPLTAVQLTRLPKQLRKSARKARRAAKILKPDDIDLGAKLN